MNYAYWLANIPGIGNRTIQRLLAQAGSARELYFLEEKGLRALKGFREKEIRAIVESRGKETEPAYQTMLAKGISFLSYEDDDYPEKLRNIPDAPYGLYIRGRLPEDGKKTVAIVGARRCSEYGRAVARRLGERLAKCGVCVVSGLAAGIDSAGHRGALRGGGMTCAVLGCGVDLCYPVSNRELYYDVLEEGGLVSEYSPGTQPLPGFFPARNRIIAGLSDAVVVVEAKSRSGSLITADHALEQGREIYAVPGRMDDALSAGCNMLIRQGAGMIVSVEDFLKELSSGTFPGTCPDSFEKLLLEKEEYLVYSCVDLRPKTVEELLLETKLSMPELAAVLFALMRRGFITETFKNCYIRRL